MRPTDRLRRQCQSDWDAATDNPFTRELAEGTLPTAKLAWYLAQDYTFIEGFVKLMGSAIATSPTLPDALPKAQFLGVIAGPENTYFQRSFEALDVPQSEREHPTLSATATGLQALMAEAATSGRHERMLAVLTGAEWSYLSWAAPYADRAPHLPFYFGEWIALHSGDYFESVVEHLRSQFDQIWLTADSAAQAQAADDFARCIALERAFFAEAYAAA